LPTLFENSFHNNEGEMGRTSIPLIERLAEIGGELQQLRWEAQDLGQIDLARDIAVAIDAIAWAAGIYNYDANAVERPGFLPPAAGQTAEMPQVTPRTIANP
jgi:hypothetical protein